MQNFNQKVYDVVQLIPRGKVATYGDIAKVLNNPKCSRQVGWALHRNPKPYIIPCHRVVFKDGSLSSSFAFGGTNAQKTLLEEEGVEFVDNKVDMSKHHFTL